MPEKYTTVARIFDVLPQLQEQVTDLTSGEMVVHIEHAESEIDPWLARRYALPLASTPPVIEMIATDLSCYRVLAQRVFTQEQLQDSVWPGVFKESRELLEKIGDGEVLLVNSDGTLVANRTTGAVLTSNTKGYLPTMHEGGRLDQVQDPNKLDDIADDRDLAGPRLR